MNNEPESELAVRLQERGYNCAQAAACAFARFVPVEEAHLYKLTEGFGGGMGDHHGTCGAVSGCIAIISLLHSNGDPSMTSKKSTYLLVDRLFERFRKRTGSSICKELLGEETGIVLRSCQGCVEDAVSITSDILREEKLI